MKSQCSRCEVLAGAIALGEATPEERDEYRNHIATCASCLQSLGGEREIERVMATVGEARESETWEPAARRIGSRATRPFWRAGTAIGVGVAALAISLALHTVLAASVHAPVTIAHRSPAPPRHSPVLRVALETRASMLPPRALSPRVVKIKPSAPVVARTPAPRFVSRGIVVVHNSIIRHGNAITQTTTQTTMIADAVPRIAVPASKVPVWRQYEAMPLQKATAAAAPSPTPPVSYRAESIAVTQPTLIRDVVPLGGDAAIDPHPPQIAYDEGASGTTAFEVQVDERGTPVKCTITKHSGYLVLDDAVCKAAMKARYSPRTVNGKPTPGVYRDAFTFRATDDDDEGISSPNPHSMDLRKNANIFSASGMMRNSSKPQLRA